MKRIKLFSLFALAVFLCQSKPAEATITINNPFGNNTTATYLGYSAGWNGTYVIQVELSTSACSAAWVGGATLSDNLVINGGGGTDFITLVRSGYPQSACGTDISVASYNGHYVDVFGKSGVDYLEGGAGNDDWIYGGDGNDSIRNYSPAGRSSGDNNDDYIVNYSSSSSDSMFGGNGNDCMYDWSQATSQFDCGVGTDTAITPGPANRVNCERVASTCS